MWQAESQRMMDSESGAINEDARWCEVRLQSGEAARLLQTRPSTLIRILELGFNAQDLGQHGVPLHNCSEAAMVHPEWMYTEEGEAEGERFCLDGTVLCRAVMAFKVKTAGCVRRSSGIFFYSLGAERLPVYVELLGLDQEEERRDGLPWKETTEEEQREEVGMTFHRPKCMKI